MTFRRKHAPRNRRERRAARYSADLAVLGVNFSGTGPDGVAVTFAEVSKVLRRMEELLSEVTLRAGPERGD